MSQQTKARWKVLLTAFTILALVMLVYITREQIWESLQNLSRVNAWALLLMPVWQFLNYHSYTKQSQGLFALLGERLRYRPMFRVMLELNFVNSVFPSGGLSGFSYFGVRMKDAEVRTAKVSLVYLLRFILVFIAFQVLLFLGLILLAIVGRANGLLILVGGSLATLVVVGTFVIAYVIGSKQRINSFFGFITRALNRFLHVFRPKHPETVNVIRAKQTFEELHDNYLLIKKNYRGLRGPLFWSLTASVSEILTIYTVYVAFGEWVNPGAVIIAYAVANFAGFISVVPGGVGAYEALMTAVLAASGVSPGLSIPVTIMYRVLNMLIQLPPGYYFYYRKLHAKSAVS